MESMVFSKASFLVGFIVFLDSNFAYSDMSPGFYGLFSEFRLLCTFSIFGSKFSNYFSEEFDLISEIIDGFDTGFTPNISYTIFCGKFS